MILTRKQEEGLRIAVDRFNLGMPYTCIAGYAGSGKSTLVRFIIDALDLPEEKVCYVAFTGKAATVLQQKGCPGATTAHKLLYRARPMPNGSYKFEARKTLEEDYQLVVVDEVSMLPASMWELLMSHEVYVLACGDPGQLPPVNPEDTNDVLEHPHIFLDEIMRQAQESEIIRLSMHVREGLPLSSFKAAGAQVQIFDKSQLSTGMMTWADQILCATNKTRNDLNNVIRTMKGFGPEPQIGDKIISLRNHWEETSMMGNWVLTNGAIGTISDYTREQLIIPPSIYPAPIPIMSTEMTLEDGDYFIQLPIDYKDLTTGSPTLTPEQMYKMKKNKACPEPPYSFAYAYAITGWKAQGSEWEKVLLMEEKFPFDKETHKKFLYTGITRASEKLVIIKK